MKYPLRSRRRLAFAAFLLAQVTLRAQTTPAVNVSSKEDPVALSPFVVATERDTGWVASSTLMGNRSNEELLNLPMSVDVLTADFMRDMGIYEIEDASALIANTVVTSELAGKLDEGRVTFRGFQLGDNVQPQSGRNFFPVFTPQDTYNVERIDFAKGANSLMFGSEQPGGLATTYTKRAYFSNFNRATAIVDSYGSYRLMLDVNRQLTDRLAARVNFVTRSDRTFIEFAKKDLRAGDVTLTYKLFPNTQLRLEAEGGQFYRKRAVNSARLAPQSAPGLGYSQTTRWTYSVEDGVVFSTGGANPSPANPADRVGPAGSRVSFLEGQSVTVAMRGFVNNATVLTGRTLTFQGFDKKINLNGPNDYLLRPYTSVTAWIEQRFGKLNLEMAYNQQNQNQERLDGGIPNQIDLTVTGNGRLFEEGAYQYKKFGNKDNNFRVYASYPVRVGWMSQFFVASVESLKDAAYNFRYTLGNLAPGTLTNNDIKFRVYLDNPGYRDEAFWRALMPDNLPRTPTFQPAWRSATTANRPFWDVRYTRTYALSSNGTYWDGLFRTLVGVRHDQFTRKLTIVPPVDRIGNVNNPGSPDDNPAAYFYDPKSDQSATSLTTGLVFRAMKNVNLFATYSESFNWQGTTDFAGNPLGSILGENREAGVKTALFENRVMVSASVYRVDKTNAAFSFGGSLTNAQLDDLFNPNDLPNTAPNYFVSASGFNGESTTAPAVARSTGYEVTIQHQRVAGVQGRLAFGHNHLTTRRDMSVFRRLYDEAVARTNAALAPGGNRALAENATLLANAATILRNNEATPVATGATSIPNTLAMAIDYEFARATSLRGTRVGVTATWNDNYNIDFTGGVIYRGGSTLPVGAYIIHERKIFGRDTYFRLGVRNLVDLQNGKLRKTGVNVVDAAGNISYDYQYVTPMSADLNATVRF